MSDALLTRIAEGIEGLLAHVKAAPAPAPKAETPKPAAAPKPEAAKPAAAPKPEAAKPAAAPKPAAAAPKPAAAPAPTKAPGGKYTSDQVREVIRKVATNKSLGKQSALDILDQDGGGVQNVTNLKPEFFDAVYEACQALLSTEGQGEGEDPFA
jgi:hypothetical protein